jgi:hypothetical protein
MTKKIAPSLVVLALMIVGGTVASTADASVRGCGSTRGLFVSVNSVTSCPFGFNVARAFASGKRQPLVYSPVTRRYYRMYCSRRSLRTYVCRGGNNAYVRLTR